MLCKIITCLMFLISPLLGPLHVCSVSASEETSSDCNQTNLSERVEQCYKALRDKDFERFVEFSMPPRTAMSKPEAVEYLKKSLRFEVVSYEMKSIKHEGARATVKMNMRYIYQGGTEDEVTHYDLWVCSGGIYYFCDFGRSEGASLEDCEE